MQVSVLHIKKVFSREGFRLVFLKKRDYSQLMSQLVPYLNFGFDDSQDSEYLYNYDSLDNAKMVSFSLF